MLFHRVYVVTFGIRTYEVRVRNPTFRFSPLYSPMYIRQKLPEMTKFPENHMHDSRAQAWLMCFGSNIRIMGMQACRRYVLELKRLASTGAQIFSMGIGRRRKPHRLVRCFVEELLLCLL